MTAMPAPTAITAIPAVPAAGTRPHPAADPTRFVLVQPSHAGNVGAAARAIKVMGFAELVLVAPRWPDVLTRDETLAMASGATDVLAAAQVVPTLAAALDGISHACATAMTPRDFGPPTRSPRAHMAALVSAARADADAEAGTGTSTESAGPHRVAFVFGPERTGLSNDDVWRCHACLSIPTHPDYGSLNLAQAVQLIAYDWRQALGGYDVVPRTPNPQRADGTAIDGVLAHWQQALVAIGYLDPAAPRKLLPRLQQLLQRAELTAEEVHILRGIARAVMAPRPPR